jgi:nucleoside-diphosphate-sugar epimerase
MRVLMIGGTGFVGSHVAARLVRTGDDVTVFHRGRLELGAPAQVRHLHGDQADLLAFARRFQDFQPEVVLDLIQFSEVTARDLVEACQGIGCRLVIISSQDVYRAYARLRLLEPGPPDPVPIDENGPLREQLWPLRGLGIRPDGDRDPEQYDKLLVERTLRENDLPLTVLRLPAVYGPGDPLHRLYPYIKRLHDGRRTVVLSESIAGWRWTRGYVENVAEGIVLAVHDPGSVGRTYNLGDAEALTEAQWVSLIGEVAGWPVEVKTVPDELWPVEADTRQHWVYDSGLIRQDLGFREHVPLREGLQRTLWWQPLHLPSEPLARRLGYTFDYAVEDALLVLAGEH